MGRDQRAELLTKWRTKGGVFLIGYTAFRNLSLGKRVKDRQTAREICSALQVIVISCRRFILFLGGGGFLCFVCCRMQQQQQQQQQPVPAPAPQGGAYGRNPYDQREMVPTGSYGGRMSALRYW